MKNIDKIRAMSAEELVLEYQSVRACEVCSYFEDDECSLKGYAGSRECNGGRIKWLNQEDNPMPKLECGDILTSLNKLIYVVVQEDYVYDVSEDSIISLKKAFEIDPIVDVTRVDLDGKRQFIWQEADNWEVRENHEEL